MLTFTCFVSILALGITVCEGKKNETCYENFGCFDLGEPWISEIRPAKIPRHPKHFPLQAIMFKRPHGNDTYRFNLYPTIKMKRVPFNPVKPLTVIIIPGYVTPYEGGWPYRLKDAFLRRKNANVFVINTTVAYSVDIFQTISDARVVGAVVTNLVAELFRLGLEIPTLHLIGHGIGAHIAGYVGEIYNVGRITGLDPLQIYFQGFPPEVRLDETDGRFVDVVHSDAKSLFPEWGFGVTEPSGHVDFYLNSGHNQPGCYLPGFQHVPSDATLYRFTRRLTRVWAKAVLCDHIRSVLVYIEAVGNPKCFFPAYNATREHFFIGLSNAEVQRPLDRYTGIFDTCNNDTCTVLGLHTPSFPFRGRTVVTTSSGPPYCIRQAPSEEIKKELDKNFKKWYNSVIKN